MRRAIAAAIGLFWLCTAKKLTPLVAPSSSLSPGPSDGSSASQPSEIESAGSNSRQLSLSPKVKVKRVRGNQLTLNLKMKRKKVREAPLTFSPKVKLKQVRGVPGIDYPVYGELPPTSFSCDGKVFGGYYADPATLCQSYHVCGKFTFLCPNGTIFNQEKYICDWWFNFDCSQAELFYKINNRRTKDVERSRSGSVKILDTYRPDDDDIGFSGRLNDPFPEQAVRLNPIASYFPFAEVSSASSSESNYLPPIDEHFESPLDSPSSFSPIYSVLPLLGGDLNSSPTRYYLLPPSDFEEGSSSSSIPSFLPSPKLGRRRKQPNLKRKLVIGKRKKIRSKDLGMRKVSNGRERKNKLENTRRNPLKRKKKEKA